MVLVGANQEITSSDYTSGMQRRRITERFENQVAPDKRRDLEHEFEPYLPGVITWALSMDDARLKQLLVETDRYVPKVGNFNQQTLKKVNPLAAWVDERLVVDPKAETPVGKKVKVTVTESNGVSKESRTVIENADKWLFANYCEWCMETGIKEMASRNFTGLLKDLLCNQLKIEGIEKLDRSGLSLSRFKGVRLRTDADSNTPSPVSPNTPGTAKDSKIQQKDSKRTANKKEGTANLAKSNFLNSENISTSTLSGEKREREREIFPIQEKPEFAGFAGFAVPNEQNQQLAENFAVPVPSRCCTKSGESPANSQEPPPSPGDGYMESLLADSYQPVTTDENEAPRPASPLSPNARQLYQWLLESKFAGWKPSSELAMSTGMDTGQVRSAAMELKAHRLARFENDSVKVNLREVN